MTRQYLLFWVTVFFILGILGGYYFHPTVSWAAGLAAGTLSLAFFFRRWHIIFIMGIFLAVMLLGAAYEKSFFIYQRGTLPNRYAFKEKVSAIEGRVASEIGEKRFSGRPKRSFTLAVQRICVNGSWKEYQGQVLAQVFRRDVALEYGECIRVTGKLHRPFSGTNRGPSSYRDYLSRQGIYWVFSISKNSQVEVLARGQGNHFYAGLLSFRERLRQILRCHLNATEAAIMETMLLGMTNDAPQYIQNLFRNTGTTHILAISGLHVTMMAVLIFILLKMLPISRRGQYVLTILLLLGYTILTGSRPSAVRSFLMSSVFLASALFERESDSLNSLAFSALIILLINPFSIFDIGFQLSYVCVLGILLIRPLFGQILEQRFSVMHDFVRVQLESFTLSFSVWIAVAGMIVYYFCIISPVTVLANLVVVPMSELVLFLGTGLLLVGLIFPFGAVLFAMCLKMALSVMVLCVYLFAKIPYGYFWVNQMPLLWVLIYYVVLIVGFLLLKRAVKPDAELLAQNTLQDFPTDPLRPV